MEAMAGKTATGPTAGQADFILSDRFAAEIPLDDKGKPKDDSKFLDAQKVLDFVLANYGRSASMVEQQIEQMHKESGHGRDLTVEEVQRIKELMLKVGTLEFRILANSVDDKEAISEAEKWLNNPEVDQELKSGADRGPGQWPSTARSHGVRVAKEGVEGIQDQTARRGRNEGHV